MLTWLNHYIGIDGATYIGVALGLLALFGIGIGVTRKIRKKEILQSARVRCGNSIQVGGNIRIENVNKTDGGNK